MVEADTRYPSDAMLALQGARALTREGKKVTKLIGGQARVRDRSRSIGKTVRAISKTLARRTGAAKEQVMKLNEQASRLIERSAAEAKRLAAAARAAARGRGAKAKLRAANKLGKPTEFGYIAQITEVTENTRKGARGFILPAAHAPGNPNENRLLAQTAAELKRAGTRPRELVVDGGFQPGPTSDAFSELSSEQIHISGRHEPGSRRTRKRRARYRTGIEGRISHLKRRYGLTTALDS